MRGNTARRWLAAPMNSSYRRRCTRFVLRAPPKNRPLRVSNYPECFLGCFAMCRFARPHFRRRLELRLSVTFAWVLTSRQGSIRLFAGAWRGVSQESIWGRETIPQRLKPHLFCFTYGTTEVVPFPKAHLFHQPGRDSTACFKVDSQQKSIPQGLKPHSFWMSCGTAEAVP